MFDGHWHLAENSEGSLKYRSYCHTVNQFLRSPPRARDMRICYQAFQSETVTSFFTKGLLQLKLEHQAFNKFLYI